MLRSIDVGIACNLSMFYN